MGPGALSSLPLLLPLLLVATGDADMKGHFDPGEETGSWVPEDGAWETEPGAVTLVCLCSPSQVPLCPGHAGQDHSRWGHLCLQLVVRLHCRSPQQVTGTPGGLLWREPLGPLLALPSPLPKPRGPWEGQCQRNPTPHHERFSILETEADQMFLVTSCPLPGWRAATGTGHGAPQGRSFQRRRSTCRWTCGGCTWWLWWAPRGGTLEAWARSSPPATGCVTPGTATAGWTGGTAGVRR